MEESAAQSGHEGPNALVALARSDEDEECVCSRLSLYRMYVESFDFAENEDIASTGVSWSWC